VTLRQFDGSTVRRFDKLNAGKLTAGKLLRRLDRLTAGKLRTSQGGSGAATETKTRTLR